MIFRDDTYSVLLVSASDKLNTALQKLLPVNTYWPVDILSSVNAARRRALERRYDLVIINLPLPDDDAVRLAAELSDSTQSGILLLAPGDLYDQICVRTEEHGVLTLSKPATERMLVQSLRLLCALRERMKRLMEKQATVEDKIEEIRLINHAKWLLIEHQGMTEPEAHRFIEKSAMDRRISKRKAAEEIIHAAEETE